MICNVCKEWIPDDAAFCPECGAPVSNGSTKRSSVKCCPKCGTEVGTEDVLSGMWRGTDSCGRRENERRRAQR